MWNGTTTQVEIRNNSMLPEYRARKQRQENVSISLTFAPLAVPEDGISSEFDDTADGTELYANMLNVEMEGKDGKNMKDKVKNSIESMLSPLITYMRLLGFINTTTSVRLKKPLLIYNFLVIICLNYYTIHKLLLLSYDGFTVRFAFTTGNALFSASGGICAIFLYFIQKNFIMLNENVIRQITLFDHDFYHYKRIRHACKLMVTIIFISSCITVLFDSMQRIDLTNKHYLTITFHTIYHLIDYYVAFMAQSALMSCTILYFLPSYILAQNLDRFTDDMYRIGIMIDGEMTTENAINKLESFQQRYQILKKAANVIEFNFKYIAFYVQTICLIELSCLFYAYLKNLNDQLWNWFDTILFSVYVCQITSFILSFIVPAYLNYEKNKKILEICPEMFEKQMQKNSNVVLGTKVLTFMYQIETMPIIFTTGGFFVVKRSLLPTLASFMLTYVFLMLQLGQTPECAENISLKTE
ncbi:Gustatory receptor family protein [Dirofilaria immitis]